MSQAVAPSQPLPVRLLRTKLFVPQAHPELVPRPRLLERLDESLIHKLALVSAPAGFGKTTVLAAWIASRNVPVAWVSLDERDSDPTRFWAYVIAALQTVWPTVGAASLAMLQSPQEPPIEGVLVELLNELAGQQGPAVLVLDDYHAIDEPAIHQGVDFLLDHLPPQLSVILSGRVDPPLSLALLRARRQLLEIRAQDLRFTQEEAAAFLNRVMGLRLQGEDVVALESLTEGWAAGLQLAALSLQEIEDVGAFVASFSGSHRYVFDYLAAEVLNRQPSGLRRFLLKTSLLTRMSGALCDAMLGCEGSQEVLEQLERANLFVVPLDRERRWYRYHHLFASFLRARLDATFDPGDITEVHRRASAWYAAHDATSDAIDHALAAGDSGDAMQQIKDSIPDMFRRSELRTLLHWISRLSQERVREDGALSMTAAWAALATGRSDAAEPYLQDVEHLLGVKADGSPDSFRQDPGVRAALAEISCIRASLAFNAQGLTRVIGLCEQARLYLEPAFGHDPDDLPGGLFNNRLALLGVAAFNLAIAQEFSGETQKALGTFREAIEIIRKDENPHLLPMCISHVAQLHLLQGRLRDAEVSYQEAVTEIGGWRVRSPLSGMAYTGLGSLYYEWNALDRAEVLLKQGVELGEQWSAWEILLTGYSGLAFIEQARGNPESAAAWLQTLAGMIDRLAMQWAKPALEAHRALLALRQGDLTMADACANAAALPEEGPVFCALEPYLLILARVRLAQGEWDRALHLLDRVEAAARQGGRGGRVLETMVIRATVLAAQNAKPEALACLGKALENAAPEGYVRMFVDEGPMMLSLLAEFAESSVYASRLVRAFGPRRDAAVREVAAGEVSKGGTLLDPLTDRELEVLALVAEGLTNRQIADRLIVSVNTVKTHVKSIYDKLDVRNRTQATLRAAELNLL